MTMERHGHKNMTSRIAVVIIVLALLIGDAAAIAMMLLAGEGITSRPFVGWIILNLVIAGATFLRKFGSSSFYRSKSQYGTPSTTLNGEKVKSRGEKLIADYFHVNNIRYVYEKPARTKGLISRHISRPDFYLPDYDVHVEYWGMVNARDEETRAKYVRSMNWKMAQYYNNGIRFISIYPHNLEDLDRILDRELRDISGRRGRL